MLRCLLLYLVINDNFHCLLSIKVSQDYNQRKNEPPDHVVPYSEHENPPEPKYVPGNWVKPLENSGKKFEFIPQRSYSQVRRSSSVKHLPREKALAEAKTDQEREEAGRLKEVVTNRKVNTFYTEEGFEDAAYDHAGHIRDADFDESYENDKKNKLAKVSETPSVEDSDEDDDEGRNSEEKLKNGYSGQESGGKSKLRHADKFKDYNNRRNRRKYDQIMYPRKHSTGENGISPRLIAENGIELLERDIEREGEEAAKGAETEVPENLRELNDSSDYDEEEYEKSDEDYEDSDSDELKETTPKTTAAQPVTAASLESYVGSIYTTVTPKYRDLVIVEPRYQVPDTTKSEYTLEPKPEYKVLQRPRASRSDKTYGHYPTLSQIYETWKRRGVEQMYESNEEPPEHRADRKGSDRISKDDNSEEYEDNRVDQAEETTPKPTPKPRKAYLVMVRNLPKLNNTRNLNPKKKFDYKYSKHATRSAQPPASKQTYGNYTGLKPPPIRLLGQVTYESFFKNSYNSSPSNPSVTQESGLEEKAAKTSIPTLMAPVPRYRYLRKYRHKQLPQLEKQSRYHRLTAGEMNNKLLSMTKILPPSPISQSEYAEYYNNHRRNGSTQPQHDPRPRVFKSHQSTLRFDVKTTVGKRPRYFVTTNRKGDEKVSVKDVKGFFNNRLNSNKLFIAREKRSDRVLLDSAPIFVDQVVDQELSKRFPEDDKVENEDGENSDEEEGSTFNESSEENSRNEKEDKNGEVEVEVEVPEFNFTEVIDQNNGHDNKTNRGNVSEERREVNAKKYPFYNKIIHASALKYVINPHQVPKKTLGGLEFYDSRDRYMDCEDIEPNLSDGVPEREEPVSEAGPQMNLPRLRGLGDKLLCLKNKYFDKEPLDNPLFSEKQVESPKMPDELDPGLLKSKFESYADYQDNSIRRVSNAPTIIDLRPIESRNLEDRKNDHELNQPENSEWSNHAKRYRKRQRTASTVSPYQREVYDDVMGTIKNLATMYRGIHVVSTSRPPPKPNHRNRFQSSKEKDQIRINSSSRDVIIPVNKQPRMRPHPKLMNYRTNKVSYRTRPMTKPFPGTGSGKVVGYFKTVRVHKRDLGYFTDSEADLAASESQLDAENVDIAAGNFDSRRIKPTGQVSNAEIRQAPEIIGRTLDNSKNSRPRGAVRFGKFTESGTETKRNEPRYTPVQKFVQVQPVKEETQRNGEEIDKKDKELDDRYDVHEDVQENPVQNLTSLQEESDKEIFHPAANENMENEEVEDEEVGDDEETEEEYEGSSEKENIEDYDEGEEEEDDDDEGEKEGEEEEEGEGEYVRSSEESKSEEASEESEPHDDEEKNYAEVSDNEKEFERFSSRPFSSFESYYDPKYSDLGPRINKPAFYHPSFESLESRSRAKYDESEESEEKKSRYVFPWHEDEEDASEESRKYEKIIKRHEFPWERRERIRRERARKKPKHGFEWSPSESVTHVQKIYPRERYSVPRKYGGLKKKKNWRDKNRGYKYDSGYRPKSKLKFKESIDENPKNKTLEIDLSTTSTPQIPATSKEFITQIPPTTPLILTTTFAPVYTVSPRFRRPSSPKTDEDKVDQVKSQSSPKKIKTTPDKKPFARRPASPVKNSVPQKYLRRSRITSPPTSTPASTSTSTSSRPTRKSTEDNTTPASRKVEHRSKVSKEEIITMSFPSMESIEIKAAPNKNSSANRVIQKVSIVTKETPDHIYRTEETDKNGIKDTVISIIPNNRTGISFKSTDVSVDRVGVNQLNNSQDLDISLPPGKNLQLSEHGTRNIISSVSWISENYDY